MGGAGGGRRRGGGGGALTRRWRLGPQHAEESSTAVHCPTRKGVPVLATMGARLRPDAGMAVVSSKRPVRVPLAAPDPRGRARRSGRGRSRAGPPPHAAVAAPFCSAGETNWLGRTQSQRYIGCGTLCVTDGGNDAACRPVGGQPAQLGGLGGQSGRPRPTEGAARGCQRCGCGRGGSWTGEGVVRGGERWGRGGVEGAAVHASLGWLPYPTCSMDRLFAWLHAIKGLAQLGGGVDDARTLRSLSASLPPRRACAADPPAPTHIPCAWAGW